MPTKDHHVILRSRIEVAIDADNHNKVARHAIHKAIEQRLIPILSKIFSAYVPSDVVIHLDKLVIDGGHLNLSTLSKQLPYEIEKRLTLTLKKEINKAIHQPKTDQVIPLPEAKQEAVAHYLSEGNFAWWMVENSEQQIEKIYLDLLEQSPLLIKQLWFNLHKKEKAVQRCLALFSRTTVERTLACLLKKPIASFTPILTEMGLLLQQTGILTGSRYAPEQPLLEMALLGAINQQRCTVERIGFLHMLLKQVAMKTSVSYQQILEKLHAHYANNPPKSLSNQATKALVQPLHDMAVMPPKFLNKNIDNKAKIIKLLDQVGNTLMASYQRSAVIRRIKAEMDKPGIRPLVKSWISEEKNRLALAKRLPYPLFVSLLQSVDPSITVYYQAHANQVQSITHLSNTEDEQAPVNEPLPAIERSLPKQIPLSKKLLDKLEMANVLWDQLIDNMDNTAAPVETCPKKEAIANQLHLSDVVDFLLYNELPNDQLVPAYLVAKVVREATCGQIRDQLAPLCQEVAILKKLIQYATEATLGKLFQAFIPFSNQLLEHLEKVIIQSKVLCNRESQADFLSIKALLITAALTHRPPTTEKQYIARIVLHLSRELSVRPTILSGQLMDAAGQITDYPLVEAFAQLKEAFTPLHLDKIDNVDLIFLSTQEKMRLDKLLLPTYFNQLLPAIKDMVRQSDSADLQLSVIYNLVLQHLPTLSGALQKTISATLHKQITTLLQSKKERVAERWHLFLHTGKLGNYTDNAALLDDVILHLPTFPLSWHKQHVRERLIANFTHAQLILLVERHSHAGQALANAIQATYQLWCATQGALEQPSSTKALFWDSVLKTFPQTAIATHFTHSTQDWLEEIITTLSNVLEIPSTTLLQTFQLLSQDSKEPSGATNLASSLNALQEKYQQKLQQQAIQCGSKSPFLTKLYLLLNGNLSLFSQRYHMPVTTLERELVQFMKAQPLELVQFLEEQANDPLVVRRIVYYFSQEVTTQIIAHLAKGHAVFVRHYLGLLGGHPLQYGSMQPHHLSMWQKELSISVIHYLITHSQFKEIECVERTLLTTSFPKEELCKIIASIIAIRPMTQEEQRIIKLLKPLVKRFTNPLINPSMLANNAFNDLPSAIEKKPSKKARPPEKAVRVYTRNGGLVFLWPFLYDFFSAHNLMTGNQFVSEQAAHNGVYLLQHLLTGQLTSPEWQLTLPKLLCGLPYDEVLLSYRPIDETYDASLQAQAMATISANRSQQGSTKKIGEGEMLSNNVIESNIELLFEKVINRWESLKKLKAVVLYQEATFQDILKSYCLNRLGILTRHQVSDGDRERLLWHLMIIHQDYDHLDLLPPWSLNSLKLPWMEEEILLFRDA